MISHGAGIIDIGGESTRPGSQSVSLEEELARVVPVIKAVKANFSIPVSCDTSKTEVMQAALDCGVEMINDVNALQSPGAVELCAQYQVDVCLMHMQNKPHNMQKAPSYENVTDAVLEFLQDKVAACLEHGLKNKHIVLDPGFGFGKTLEQNYRLLADLEQLTKLPYPCLVGFSRKSMVHRLLNTEPEDCLPGSLALATAALLKGAKIIRTHDVAQTNQVLQVTKALLNEAG